MRMFQALKPISIGQLLDRAVRLYRHHFWTFLAIVAVVQLPIALLSLLSTAGVLASTFAAAESPLDFNPAISPIVPSAANSIATLLGLLFGQFSSAAIAVVTVRAIFGRPVSFRSAYRAVLGRWRSLIGVSILLTATAIGLVMLTLLLTLTIVGWIGGVGVLMFFGSALSPLVVIVMMLEERSAWTAIGRTWNLLRRPFWRTVRFTVATYLFANLSIIGLQALFGAAMAVVIGINVQNGASVEAVLPTVALTAVVTSLATLLVAPLTAAALTLYYLDLRVRYEGVDLVVGMAPDEPAAALAVAPVQPSGERLVTGREARDFMALGCLPFVLVLLLFAIVFGLTAMFALLG